MKLWLVYLGSKRMGVCSSAEGAEELIRRINEHYNTFYNLPSDTKYTRIEYETLDAYDRSCFVKAVAEVDYATGELLSCEERPTYFSVPQRGCRFEGSRIVSCWGTCPADEPEMAIQRAQEHRVKVREARGDI